MDKYGREEAVSVVGTYKGFSIIRVTTTQYGRSPYSNKYSKVWGKTNVYQDYFFCKAGSERKPTQRFVCYCSNLESAKKNIDRLLSGAEVILTRGEYARRIQVPNEKCEWGFSKADLLSFMKKHERGDKKTKYVIEERLTDANFHSYCGLLFDGKYDKFAELVKQEYGV